MLGMRSWVPGLTLEELEMPLAEMIVSMSRPKRLAIEARLSPDGPYRSTARAWRGPAGGPRPRPARVGLAVRKLGRDVVEEEVLRRVLGGEEARSGMGKAGPAGEDARRERQASDREAGADADAGLTGKAAAPPAQIERRARQGAVCAGRPGKRGARRAEPRAADSLQRRCSTQGGRALSEGALSAPKYAARSKRGGAVLPIFWLAL